MIHHPPVAHYAGRPPIARQTGAQAVRERMTDGCERRTVGGRVSWILAGYRA
jgi:hypothetical protein